MLGVGFHVVFHLSVHVHGFLHGGVFLCMHHAFHLCAHCVSCA